MKKPKEKINAAQDVTLPQGEVLTDGLADIVGDIANQAPTAQPGVIAAYAADEQANKQAAPAQAPTPSQAPGEKRGRPLKPESELKHKRRVKVPKAGEVPTQQALAAGSTTNKETAALFTLLKEQLTIGLIGKEWELKPDERTSENTFLTAALDKYAPMGMPVNPLVMYAGVSAMHAAKRFQMPETQTWWGRQKIRVAAWWLTRKQKKELKNAAHADSGTNHDGKDNSGDTAGGTNKG